MIVVVFIDLPKEYRFNTTLFGTSVDYTFHAPVLDLTPIGINWTKSFTTHLGLDLSGGTHIVLEADMTGIAQGERESALSSAKEVIERRVNFFGVSEPVVQTAQTKDSYRIIVELPGVTDVEQAVTTIGQTAKLEFKELDPTLEATTSATIPDVLTKSKDTGVTGSDLKKSALTFSSENGEPMVSIEFTPEGSKKFAALTTRLVGRKLAIFLDGMPLMWPAPNVKEPIENGQGVIQGGFTTDSAKTLALQLNAGALPVPVSIVEKRTVGATLGAESVQKSIFAGSIGLIIVALFMIAKYGWLGLIADSALVFYGLIAFAVFRAIPVVLTLPGIAGFILSIGMAVDSNILIFERFKEEKRRGKPWKIAMELGFGRAWESIKDANLTTILTALILYNPGNWSVLPTSGLVRGFAATLLIGVLISLFTGIVVTRTLIRVLYKEK